MYLSIHHMWPHSDVSEDCNHDLQHYSSQEHFSGYHRKIATFNCNTRYAILKKRMDDGLCCQKCCLSQDEGVDNGVHDDRRRVRFLDHVNKTESICEVSDYESTEATPEAHEVSVHQLNGSGITADRVENGTISDENEKKRERPEVQNHGCSINASDVKESGKCEVNYEDLVYKGETTRLENTGLEAISENDIPTVNGEIECNSNRCLIDSEQTKNETAEYENLVQGNVKTLRSILKPSIRKDDVIWQPDEIVCEELWGFTYVNVVKSVENVNYDCDAVVKDLNGMDEVDSRFHVNDGNCNSDNGGKNGDYTSNGDNHSDNDENGDQVNNKNRYTDYDGASDGTNNCHSDNDGNGDSVHDENCHNANYANDNSHSVIGNGHADNDKNGERAYVENCVGIVDGNRDIANVTENVINQNHSRGDEFCQDDILGDETDTCLENYRYYMRREYNSYQTCAQIYTDASGPMSSGLRPNVMELNSPYFMMDPILWL